MGLLAALFTQKVFEDAGMPRPAQITAEALPMTRLMGLIQGVILRGVSLPELSSELFILVAITLAILRFSKRPNKKMPPRLHGGIFNTIKRDYLPCTLSIATRKR